MVFDGVDGTVFSPVDGLWDTLNIEDGGVGGLNEVVWFLLVSEESLVLILSPVGELVMSEGE